MAANKRGAVLIEALISVVLCLLALGLNLEMVRRAQFEIVFHHAAFLAARQRALGQTWPKVRQTVNEFLRRSVPGAGQIGVQDLEEKANDRGLTVTVRFRFPSFYRFRAFGQNKHHFELSRSCHFPWSF